MGIVILLAVLALIVWSIAASVSRSLGPGQDPDARFERLGRTRCGDWSDADDQFYKGHSRVRTARRAAKHPLC